MKFIEGHLKVHSEALALRSQRNEILSSNIANAGTPNFKAKDLDFDNLLNNKMGVGEVNISDQRHFKMSLGPNEEGVQVRQNVTPSQAWNAIELHVEQMKFTANVMRYQQSFALVNHQITCLRDAINGE